MRHPQPVEPEAPNHLHRVAHACEGMPLAIHQALEVGVEHQLVDDVIVFPAVTWSGAVMMVRARRVRLAVTAFEMAAEALMWGLVRESMNFCRARCAFVLVLAMHFLSRCSGRLSFRWKKFRLASDGTSARKIPSPVWCTSSGG